MPQMEQEFEKIAFFEKIFRGNQEKLNQLLAERESAHINCGNSKLGPSKIPLDEGHTL